MNPLWRMKKILEEAYIPEPELLETFGIREEWMDRYPIELSGGELQRFSICESTASADKISDSRRNDYYAGCNYAGIHMEKPSSDCKTEKSGADCHQPRPRSDRKNL